MADTIAKFKACFRLWKTTTKLQPSESSFSENQPEEQKNSSPHYFLCVYGVSIYFCIILRLYRLFLKIAKSLLGFSPITAHLKEHGQYIMAPNSWGNVIGVYFAGVFILLW